MNIMYYILFMTHSCKHYEFNDIAALNKIMYKITLPKVKNGLYYKHAYCLFIKEVVIQISVNDILLDERIIDPTSLILHNELYGKHKSFYISIPDPQIIYIPLLPRTMEKSFDYLLNCDNYTVTCTVKINETPKIELLCIPFDEKVKVELDGEICFEEINENVEERITIYL